ncbi:hypothetical protein FAUST_1567 [Fusarium austroamericanum]|uniref:Heterokaryon incompatibility domain-containing protein n=1 Tax=Fusarium austroamericanum TaxID=282268 RepID=A0AAN6C8A2_FUSAU|nr:hypothetical protein FAUST_1567 [Fusarium austroamericanum]
MFTGVRPETTAETIRPQTWDECQAAASLGCYVCGWIVYMERFNQTGKIDQCFETRYSMEFSGDCITYWSFIRIKRDGAFDVLLGFLPIPESDMTCYHHGLGGTAMEEHRPFERCSDQLSPRFQLGDQTISGDASNWIAECKMNHEKCRAHSSTFRPTRLIEIMSANQVRLIWSADLESEIKVSYVAFSHCWGDVDALKLEGKNVNQLFAGFETDTLPQTYRDAIAICVQLQYRFIWIDSLCIIQDSRSDWQNEATMMGSVYANADLNICAASAANSSQNLFPERDKNLLTPLDITSSWEGEGERRLRIVPADLLFAEISLCPLRKRAWVFQEWYLSKRSLILGSMQAWWQCHELLACETFPNGVPEEAGVTKYWNAETEAMKGGGKTMADWVSQTALYANTALTREEDRLMAFAGVAESFKAFHNLTEGYVAGLWRQTLPGSLAWANHGRKPALRSKEYKAPSWSWLSLDGPYELLPSSGVNNLECCTVEDIWLNYVDSSHDTGLLRGGSIQLRGCLIGPVARRSDGNLSEEFIINTYCQDSKDIDQVEYWAGGDQVEFNLKFDEKDANHAIMVSYLDIPIHDHYQKGLINGATRRTMPLEDVDGPIYLLHMNSELDPESEQGLVQGIILYQPLHQVDIFHRIGYYGILSSDTRLEYSRTLTDRYPIRSVLIL